MRENQRKQSQTSHTKFVKDREVMWVIAKQAL